MKTAGILAITILVFLAIANLDFATLHAQSASGVAKAVQQGGNHSTRNAPQPFVVCTGWHALCSASPDCRINGNRVDCDCLRVNETHIIATSEIQDLSVKVRTEVKCTEKHPCDIDQAPICQVIQNGQYEVDNIRYDWVSTYSYRNWCSLQQEVAACVPGSPGYSGDTEWAICDLAPCTEIQNPSNPEKPLSCQCRLQQGAFVGTNGSCTGDNGGIMSSMTLSAWDFEKNTYTFPMPGYQYVQGACAPLKSDPLAVSATGNSRP